MREPNAGSWKKGQSGNPGGRHRLDPVLHKTVRDMCPELFERLRQIAMAADSDSASVKAIQLLLAYAVGSPDAQPGNDLTRPGPNPLDELTVEELRALARQSLTAETDDDADDDEADEPPH